MGRSIFESVVVFVLCVALIILGNSLNLEKFNRRYAQGTAPVIKSQRLPLRFSLRTLLIAMTLAAVGTALVMFAIR